MSIYLDNLAATPVDPRVAKYHCKAMAVYLGNAHSAEHSAGVEAQQAIDHAAAGILENLGCQSEDLLFTPGASSALWLAVEDCVARVPDRPARIAVSAAEHPALLSALTRAAGQGRIELTTIAVDSQGAPCLGSIGQAIRSGTDLVCTMAANNEVGTISDVASISALVASSGARLLVDASQAAGKIDLGEAMHADLIVISGAKIYGPRRTGALIGSLSKKARELAHDLLGSPDPASASALSFAVELRDRERHIDEPRLERMRDRLQARLEDRVSGLRINGSTATRLAGSLHVSTPHAPGEAVVAQLYGRVAISTSAACQSGVPGSSHVLDAMGLPDWAREGAVRIGLGRFNSEHEVEEAGELIARALTAAQPDRKYA